MSQIGGLSLFISVALTELGYFGQHDLTAMSTKTPICTAADQTPTNQAQLSDTVLPHAG